jgi:hypothetical protein
MLENISKNLVKNTKLLYYNFDIDIEKDKLSLSGGRRLEII